MQINSEFDNIISGELFKDSYLFKKIKRVIYIHVCNKGSKKDWYFHSYPFWDLEKNIELYDTLKDY